MVRQGLFGPLLLILFLFSDPSHTKLRKASKYDPTLISYLFDRLGEPIFFPKGTEQPVVFNVSDNYLNNHIQPMAAELGSGFIFSSCNDNKNATFVNLPNILGPDLGPAAELGRDEYFSLFIPRHRLMAHRLIEIFLGQRSYDDFLAVAAFCRDKVNPFLFAHALAVAMLHHPETRTRPMPNAAAVFPHKYFDGSVFSRLRQQSYVLMCSRKQEPIEIPRNWTATDLEPEHRVAYFREDIGINLFHWHWHLVYPFNAKREIVDKDRRGELFYYVHQQILARYNFERLSNELSRSSRFLNWREPIQEGYFPKLTVNNVARSYSVRQAGAKLSDVKRGRWKFDILDMERYRDRIMDAIHTRRVQSETGDIVPLDNESGIDILGNLVEASNLSINHNFYGDLHNFGHLAIAFVHDPDYRHLEPMGVMGEEPTAMRDPIFYRWHAFVQSVFEEHKTTMPSYSKKELNFPDVEVKGLKVQTVDSKEPNEFSTFWQKSDIDISRGLDFYPGQSIFVRVTHLQQAPFWYNIEVHNGASVARNGTVRIFLAPLLDESRQPFDITEQRTLFIELDKFRVLLRRGTNIIKRWYNESSLTIPPERTFRDLDKRPPGEAGAQFDYCGCGWPQHMLLPRGSPAGLRASLFVMVSDYENDEVEDIKKPNECSDGHSYCGILGHKYPDRRSMGFPFDRLPRDGANTLQEFLTPNMAATEVLIRHEDRIVTPDAPAG